MNGCTVQCARLKSGQSRWLVGPAMPRIVMRCLVGDVVARDAAPKSYFLKNESAGMRRRSEAQSGRYGGCDYRSVSDW